MPTLEGVQPLGMPPRQKAQEGSSRLPEEADAKGEAVMESVHPDSKPQCRD